MKSIVCIGARREWWFDIFRDEAVRLYYFDSVKVARDHLKGGQPADLLLYEAGPEDPQSFCRLRYEMMSDPALSRVPFILLSGMAEQPQLERLARRFEVRDYYGRPFNRRALRQRVLKLLREPSATGSRRQKKAGRKLWTIPWWKRLFDVLATSVLLILLLPLFLIVALLIKLESPGPVFYTSKRAGQGYRVFDFYKFRSMRINADSMLEQLKNQNQYQGAVAEGAAIQLEPANRTSNSLVLIMDDVFIEEHRHQLEKGKNGGKGAFFKVVDDPRITRIGRFIRSTSIDELPQLINVLKGDMSLVGNRPLPLYEAEQLTEDDWVMRFGAPAGITGLWQVTRRGDKEMSEEERKQLDVEYACSYNFWFDLWILWRTLPAAIQKANV